MTSKGKKKKNVGMGLGGQATIMKSLNVCEH